MRFLVVDSLLAYNVIFSRPSLNLFRVIASTYHIKVKFPTPSGVGEEVGDTRQAKKCYADTLRKRAVIPGANSKMCVGQTNQGKSPPLSPAKISKGEPSHRKGKKTPQEETKKRKLEEEHLEAIEEVKVVEFYNDPLKTLKIGSLLDAQVENALVEFLQSHLDVFAWDAADMCGISPEVMVHKLNADPKAKPVK